MDKRVGMLGLLVALLLVAMLGSGAVAQEPSASPQAEVQRVEVPEAGLAIGLPDGWHATVQMEAVTEAVTVVLSLESLWQGTCGVVEIGLPGLPTTIEFIEDELVPRQWFAQPDFPGGYDAARLVLPAGEVVRVSFDEVRADLDDAMFHNVNHLFPADDRIVALQCSARSALGLAPEADWSTMARTLEFLPRTATPSPTDG